MLIRDMISVMLAYLKSLPEGTETSTSKIAYETMRLDFSKSNCIFDGEELDFSIFFEIDVELRKAARKEGIVLDASIYNGLIVGLPYNVPYSIRYVENFDEAKCDSDIDRCFVGIQISIAPLFEQGCPVSRSEARRFGEMILNFKEIILDFTNVEEVGQAFVYELFVVWQSRNPDVQLKYIYTVQAVENMIRRVLNTK